MRKRSMHRSIGLVLLAFITAVVDLTATARSADVARPNVLFLLADDLRPDAIAALGNPTVRTPHLDELAHRGTVFTRAVCAHPLCLPSRAELLTGCTGFTNGLHPPQRREFDRTLATWPRTLADAGYRTCYIGKWHTPGRPSEHGWQESPGLFASGGGKNPLTHPFDHRGERVTGYVGWVFQTDDRQRFPEHGIGLTPETDATIAAAAIEFLKRAGDGPFFLQVNFAAPHDPLLFGPGEEDDYDPAAIPLPPNYRPAHPFDHGNLDGRDERLLPVPRTPDDVRRELAAYNTVVTRLDAQIGRILACLDETRLSEETLVIFSSDHGLAVGSHGLRGKQNMYEHTIGVPLFFAGPGVPVGKTRDAQCYLRDLFPTVCELVGVPTPPSVEGQSLAGVIRGEQQEVYPFVVGYFADSQRMIRTEHWKYIWYPQIEREQLFDLVGDPHELDDLSDDPARDVIKTKLRSDLHAWLLEAAAD